ncbi:unnamed protein product [Clonostachys rhizophaga]|uniref:Zn(2)-C6 fungal-type domain-containing protein n=1 Tax=Clonostachys rhizophaga TaxID=160324 RepID=A0A9N9YMU7_9HYPO|nr:unnamed protein product [Clonostachys rhizophaga]
MFGTWKYDPETDEVQNLRQAFDPITARSSQHQACNRCHEKKLKCSGEKDGCERCAANKLQCEYTRSSSRGSRRGKKNRVRSTEGAAAAREDSPSNPPPPPRRSHSRSSQLSPNQPTTSLSTRAARPAAPTPTPPLQPPAEYDQERMLDRLDFSLLQPEDSFDLGSLSDAQYAGGFIPTTTLATCGAYHAQAMTATSPPIFHHHDAPRHDSDSYQAWHQQGFVQVPPPQASAAAMGHPHLATSGQGYAVPMSTYTYQPGYQSQLDPRYQWVHRGDGEER